MYSNRIKTKHKQKTQGSMDWCRNIFICIVALIENLLDSYFSTRFEFGVNNEMILLVAAEKHLLTYWALKNKHRRFGDNAKVKNKLNKNFPYFIFIVLYFT